MRSAGTTTLFTESADNGPQPASFAVSFVLHSLAIAIVWFAVMYNPRIARVVTDRYSVRKLDLHMQEEMEQLTAQARNDLPAKPAPKAPSGGSTPSPAAAPQTAQTKIGPQTLVQPDLNKQIQLSQEVPLPQVVIWSPAKVQVKVITPPQPQKPTSAEVKPSVVSPNQELNLADVNVASSFHPSPKNIVPPSTTSPLTIHSPAPQVQMPPVTSSQSALQATPVQILSLSDLRAKDASVTLPPVNETKPSTGQGIMGAPQKSGQGQTNSNSTQPNGAGQGQQANATNPGAGSGQGSAPSSGAVAGSNAGPAHPGAGSTPGSDQGETPAATVISVPKDGHFGSVIVGDSLQDRYPEIADIWSGRLTYTAYLHVGLSKSWILQYSLPRKIEASQSGNVARLDAPWPYSIVRPNLEPGSVDADALMVHGFVNQSGRFETLTVLFPEGFSRAQFVLAALQQWQFRPAAQDGQPARVEVLLIIPQEYE
jgi:hypothetical protein